MNDRVRVAAAVAATVAIFLCIQLGALALVEPFVSQGYQPVENPEDPTNSGIYLVAILVATGVMLAAFKLQLQALIRGLLVATSGLLSWYVFSVVVPPVVVASTPIGPVDVLATAAAAAVAVALWVYPEWYVIDLAGIVMGAGAAGLFGISFGVLPAILLLVVLAVYDAISVYGTEHMLTLAAGVMEIKVPVLLIVPTTLSYSFLEATAVATEAEEDEGTATAAGDGPATAAGDGTATVDGDGAATAADEGAATAADEGAATAADEGAATAADGAAEEPGGAEPFERDALFIGLGDAVMPTIMVASAAVFLDVPAIAVPAIALNLPALTALIGTLLGLVVLLWLVLQGRAHAGLPLLNGGAIGGYLLGALASGVSLVEALGLAGYL